MRDNWQTAPLGKLLERAAEEVALEDGLVYRELTVRLWNKGVVLRGEKRSSEIKTRRFCVQAGQLILSRIDARNGAIGLVPAQLDGAIVSGEFWTYKIDHTQIDPQFLSMYVATPSFLEAVNRTSSGTTHRIRAEEESFLAIEIPLPTLHEQQRIVARVDALARRVEEARGLRSEAVEQTVALYRSVLRESFKSNTKVPEVPLESVCAAIIDNLHSNPVYCDEGRIPCVRSPDVGWGELFLEIALKTDEQEYKRRTVRAEPSTDDIVLVREGGGTGKAAIVEKGQRFSLGQRVMMLRPNKGQVDPKFLLYQLLSPAVYEEQIVPLSKGSASPHLNLGALRKFRLLLPGMAEQRRIVAYLDGLHAQMNELRRLQAETQKELDALMPSILAKAFAGEL